MKRRLAVPLTVGLVLLLTSAFVGLYLAGDDPAQARVVQVYGQVERSDNTGRRSPLKTGDNLTMGETVATGPESGATLVFIDDSRLILAENSRVVLTHLVIGRSGNSSDTRLRLEAGGAESRINRDSGFSSEYRVLTPALQLAVRGTVFMVKVDNQTGRTRTMVLQGNVEAEGSGGDTIPLMAGEGLVSDVGEPLGRPRALPPAPELDALPQRIERLPLTPNWAESPQAQSYQVDVHDSSAIGPAIYSAEVSAPTVVIASLPDGDYRLRVRGIDAQGLEGDHTEVRFTLFAHPVPPRPQAPVAEQTLPAESRVRLIWEPAQAAERYRVQVSDRADFSSLITDIQELPAPLNRLTLRLQPGHYYWRAASWNQAEGFGPFSDTEAFRVASAVDDD